MADELSFVEYDARKVYQLILGGLEQSVGDPLYPGDERRIFGEALVALSIQLFAVLNEAARQRMLRYARGTVLDALGERLGAERLEPQSAQTTLRFHASAPQTRPIIIPAGTRATPNGKLYFATVQQVSIEPGAEYVDALARGTDGGSIYNGYAAGSISVLVDLIPFIARVENVDETNGGDDGEPYNDAGDEHYRERIRLAINSFSTAGPIRAYEYWALTANPGIVDVTVFTPEPGVVQVVPLMAGGSIPDESVLRDVEETLNDETHRPLTDRVIVTAPEIVEYDIDLTYYVTKDAEGIAVDNVEGVAGAIERYITWQDMAIGRDINPDQLRKLVLCPDWAVRPVGALRLDVREPVFKAIHNTQVSKWSGRMSVRHEVVYE